MVIKNKMHKIFGPSGVAAGFFLLLAGIILLTKGWGIVLIVIGAFFFLSFNGVLIDTENRKVKSYLSLFGCIKIGKWKSIEEFIGLTIVPVKRINVSYSRSNRQLVDEEREYQIFFVNRSKQPEMAIMRSKDVEDAQENIEDLSFKLHLPVFSPEMGRNPY